jgi:hypothetical protein
MARGGKRPGAGRKPGGLPDKTAAAAAVVEKHAASLAGIVPPDIARMTPLEVMLHAMTLEAAANQWRAAAALAKEAAPYVHPKLATETHRVLTDDGQRSEEDLRHEEAELARRIAASSASQATADQARTVASDVPEKPDRLVH